MMAKAATVDISDDICFCEDVKLFNKLAKKIEKKIKKTPDLIDHENYSSIFRENIISVLESADCSANTNNLRKITSDNKKITNVIETLTCSAIKFPGISNPYSGDEEKYFCQIEMKYVNIDIIYIWYTCGKSGEEKLRNISMEINNSDFEIIDTFDLCDETYKVNTKTINENIKKFHKKSDFKDISKKYFKEFIIKILETSLYFFDIESSDYSEIFDQLKK